MPNVAAKSKPNSHVKDLLLLFAVPLSIVVIAAILIYVPRLFAHPKYSFIYSTCSGYDCRYNYTVDSSGYVSQDYSGNSYSRNSELKLYDTSTDSNKTVSLSEVRSYQLNTSSRSPDGYELSRISSDGGFLFWGDYKDGWYLKKGMIKKQVNLDSSGSYYSHDINFLGWINK